MPVSKRHSEHTDLRIEAAELMGIDLKDVFLFKVKTRKPALAIWIGDWSEAEVGRCKALKPEIKALAATHGAKIYMTAIHPFKQEKRESRRRWSRGLKYLERQALAESEAVKGHSENVKESPKALEALAALELKALASLSDQARQGRANPPNISYSKLRKVFKLRRKNIYKTLVNSEGEVCAYCGHERGLTIDHILGVAKGGKPAKHDDYSNFQLLCPPCHRDKSEAEETSSAKEAFERHRLLILAAPLSEPVQPFVGPGTK